MREYGYERVFSFLLNTQLSAFKTPLIAGQTRSVSAYQPRSSVLYSNTEISLSSSALLSFLPFGTSHCYTNTVAYVPRMNSEHYLLDAHKHKAQDGCAAQRKRRRGEKEVRKRWQVCNCTVFKNMNCLSFISKAVAIKQYTTKTSSSL